jgi:hypothetical protein
MPIAADTSDTTERLAHIRPMLAHLGQEEQEAAPEGPTDVLTELSALMDLYLSLSRLTNRLGVARWTGCIRSSMPTPTRRGSSRDAGIKR